MKRISTLLVLGAGMSLLAACERPPVDAVQLGFRGVAMEYVENPRTLADSVASIQANIPSPIVPPADEPMAAGTYENVQVLGHLSLAEFTLTMQALTEWVAPSRFPGDAEWGCNYCHVINPGGEVNYASDDNYTKLVSRRMLQMVQDINVNWTSHVGEDRGVNCYTCHQGQPVPNNLWFYTDQNQPLRHYLDRDDLRVQGTYALAREGDSRQSIKQMEYAYSLMMNMSNSLGVNCTYCHNSARFADWTESPPQRVTALRGLRMVRHTNLEYMLSLQDVWPENRLGPLGDGPKQYCATCHNGAYKPHYSNPLSWGADWRALAEIGYPNPPAAEPAAEDTTSAASAQN